MTKTSLAPVDRREQLLPLLTNGDGELSGLVFSASKRHAEVRWKLEIGLPTVVIKSSDDA